ncbi:MAG: sodium ion-translocating decarboxylase subunit beta, partial [Treponema sp.]|nr:sodium ion-translocating decarboxylase subunit beta [Treponema sp.]
MIDTQKDFRKKVFSATLAIMAIAMVLSMGTKVLAQTKEEVSVESMYLNETPAATAPAESGSGLERVIKGTENWGDEHNISVSRFIQNIGKSTGIYQIITQKKVDPSITGLKPEIKEAPEKDWGKAPGWQSLIMIAIGFLIVYLAVGKGFEPLLLIPIGFGTILVNIVGAGMGDLPDGMLAIIYHA